MPNQPPIPDMEATDAYPDPLGAERTSGIYPQLVNIALSADFPALRVFSNLPVLMERDIRRETDAERARQLSE